MANHIHNAAKEDQVPAPGIMVSGYFDQPYGYRTNRSKGTRDFLMMFTLSGCGLIRYDDQIFECREGDIAMIMPGTPHHYATAENAHWEFYWCHFVPPEDWTSLLQLPEKVNGIKWVHMDHEATRKRLANAFARLIEYNVETNSCSERLSLNALEEVLLLVYQNCKTEAQKMDARIEEIIHLMSQNFKRPFTISEMAAKVNLSASRFAHLFKEQTGESVMEMLIKIRLRHAKKLLEFTTLSVAEIASEVGFNNPFYFTRQFTAFFGIPPAHFRKRIQKV